MGKFILWFDDIGRGDIEKVGGKCANLGELASLGVPTLPGFAVTADAYKYFIKSAGLRDYIKKMLEGFDAKDIRELRKKGKMIRRKIISADMPDDLSKEIINAYKKIGDKIGTPNPFVAVRSSATAEDLPGASFAGQQDTYLNVTGEKDLLKNTKDCFASLFTDRAISYRIDKGFNHFKVSLSVGVQKMGRSDVGASGVMFSMDPDSGFDGVVVINGTYGLGEYLVQGKVTPDLFIVFKKTMKIIEKTVGSKKVKLIRSGRGNREARVSEEDRNKFCITDEQAKRLAKYAITIENHYKNPMDIEW
ncbi:MAG: phosphoenolpyruvate synthase, partial [Deltaproteobacteria bacterium]|nr:phosphoenolpyruvate synthase [Deltaproteobacteria bacterium]